MSDIPAVAARAVPRIVEIGSERPWQWLVAGWRDMRRLPTVSLGYGLCLAAISWGLTLGLWFSDALYLLLPLGAGFMFVGPLVVVGLYEASRRLEQNKPCTFRDAIFAWRRNPSQIAMLGLVLMLFQLFWVRLALLIFALFFGPVPARLDNLLATVVLSKDAIPFLIVGTATGAVLAVLVFSISVVSVPMLLDRDVGVADAMTASLHVVQVNWKVMVGWGALIVQFTAAGIALLLLGLAVVLPLLAHASWHAYRDMVAYDTPGSGS
ncbi:MAG: DUF2189 domain-containing protein [Rhodospirillales bacterium]